MSDFEDEEEAQEIQFDQYFNKDDKDEDFDDDFESSSHSLKQPKSNPAAQIMGKSSPNKQNTFGNNSMKAGLGNAHNAMNNNTKKANNADDDEKYDSFEEESKHSNQIKIGGTKGAIEHSDNFDEDDDDGDGFDNAFKYEKEEFKSEISDSNDNQIPVVQNQNNDFAAFSIKKEENPFATKKNITPILPIAKQQTNVHNQVKNQQSFGGKNQMPNYSQNRQQTSTAQEIKFAPVKDDIKTDSDAGFIDDDIEDEVEFQSEEDQKVKIDKNFPQNSSKPQQQQLTQNKNNVTGNMMSKDNQTLVNMGSVIPNPKIVQGTQIQTINNKNQTLAPLKSKGSQKTLNPFAAAQEMDEQSNIYPEFEYEHEDSMEDIHQKINAIPSRFSDIGSPDKDQGFANPPQKQPSNTGSKGSTKQLQPLQQKQTVQKSGGVDQNTRQASKPRPQTAKVSTNTATQNKRGTSKPPAALPKPQKQRNNNDLGSVMNDEELKQEDQPQSNNQSQINNNNMMNSNSMVNMGSIAERVTKNLLQNRMKNSRVVLRPESAKPKVGYDGQPNVLGKVKPISANHNDLTAQLAMSKKFQMLKKLKQEKEKKQEMTVRNLKKANVIKDKQKIAKEQQMQQQQSKNASGSQPAQLFKDEFDGDDFFEEADQIVGDQAVGPGGGGGMNDEFDNDFNEQNSMNNSVRQSVKDLAAVSKLPDKKPPTQTLPTATIANVNTNQNTQNNTQQLQAANNTQGIVKALAKQTPQSMALQQQKEQQAEVKSNTSKVLGGDNNERFQEILRQKKDKEVNKDVMGFMMEKNLKQQQDKQQAYQSAINPLAKNIVLKDQPKHIEIQANKPSDKVPEHAKLVVDDEKLSKELMDLKRRFKETNIENLKISSNIELIEAKKREKEALVDKIMNEKNLVLINGSYKMQNSGQSGNKNNTSLFYGIKMEDIPDFDKIAKEKINPLDSIVKKIENKGMTLEQAFNLFDDDGDEVLTVQEIKNGIKMQGIALLDTEMLDLIKAIDANSDGVLTLEEWINTLNPKFDAEKEFRAIMQNIDIDDPLILEERILDLRFRSQRLERELEIMRETSGEEQGFNYKDRVRRKMKNPMQKKFADKILNLEERLNNKVSNILFEKIHIENKIQQSLMAKDQVHQDFYEAQRIKERIDIEYEMRLQQIQDNLNIQDHKLNDATQLSLMIKGDRENLKTQISRMQVKITSMSELEAKLDKQLEQILGKAIDGKDLEMLYELDLKILRQLNSGSNQKFSGFLQYIGCVTIQRIFRGIIGRRDAKIFKFQRERFARKLQPIVRAKLNKNKIQSATIIQKMFRRYRQRKQQLETLKKKNQMKKLLEEEEDRNYQSFAQRMEAARTILRYWREHKRKQLTDFATISKINQRNAFNKTIEVVYIPSIKKCFICKKQNAGRQCPGCQDCLYCDECYIEYHARGHRKVHNYKRVRFGMKPYDEKESEQEFQNYIKKTSLTQENKNPNSFMPNNNAQTSSQGKPVQNTQDTLKGMQMKNEVSFSDGMVAASIDSFGRETLKNTALNAQSKPDDLIYKVKVDATKTQQNQLQKAQSATVKSTKSVRLSDEGFLRSLKQLPNLRQELVPFNNDDIENNEYMRLADIKQALLSKQKLFKISPDDVEILCEIAENKCSMLMDGNIKVYIDLVKLQNMINA
eukprot:403376652